MPLDPTYMYSVVSNNYIRNGGDGYKMFKTAQNAPYQPYLAGRIVEK